MIRIALIGAGTMGKWYAKVFKEYDGAELVAICDLDGKRAQAVADESGGKVYTDYRLMLAKEKLDAVAVATPDRFHRQPVVDCLGAGKHVLCEKPLSTTLEDGLAMKEAVGKSGKQLMINFGNRHRPRGKKLRELLLEKKAVGEIATVYIELNERLSKTSTLAWSAETSPLWFLLSHCVDYVRFTTGLEIVEVFGYETRKVLKSQGHETSDTCIFVGKLSNGGHIFLGSSWAYPDDYVFDLDFPMRVIGTRGLIEAQMHARDMMLHSQKPPQVVNYTYNYLDYRGHKEDWWSQSTRSFLHCIKTGERATPDVDDGLACLKVLLAMEESIRTGRPVATG
jgi:predicted dehydrogenase